jgi:hypothetical protein
VIVELEKRAALALAIDHARKKREFYCALTVTRLTIVSLKRGYNTS